MLQELVPGQFNVHIVCQDRTDLRSDVVEGLSGLPVRLSHECFTSVAPAGQAQQGEDGASGIASVELLVSSLPTAAAGTAAPSAVTAEQLQLALYMTVSCSCPIMSSSMDDLTLSSMVPAVAWS